MIELLNVAAWALIGAVVWWSARDDDTEVIGPIRLTSGTWKAIIIVMAAMLLYEAHVGILKFAVALLLFVAVLTAPHNLLLSPPKHQVLARPRDIVQQLLYRAFGKKAGEIMGMPMYVTYSIIRYALPISCIGAVLQTWPMVVAGPLASIAYYPFVHSEKSKYVRAAICGALVMSSFAATKYVFAGF